MFPIQRGQAVRAGLLACLLLTAAVTGVAAAGTTAVSLEPAETTAAVGETVAFDVVVENADGGVGAWEATVNLTDGAVAEIAAVRLHGNPGLRTVEIAADNDSVYFDGALANTDDTGAVTIATVELEVTGAGDTGVDLAIEALGDESGNSYTVSRTDGGTLASTSGTSADGTTTADSTEERSTATAADESGTTDESAADTESSESTATEPTATDAETDGSTPATTETSTEEESSAAVTDSTSTNGGAVENGPSSDVFAPGFSLLSALLAIALAALALGRH